MLSSGLPQPAVRGGEEGGGSSAETSGKGGCTGRANRRTRLLIVCLPLEKMMVVKREAESGMML